MFFRSLGLLVAFYAFGVQAQTIPSGSTTEWSAAGNSLYNETHSALINISNMGAVGNSSTNDDSIIQKAIDSLFTSGGGVVFIPEGSYALNQGLTLKSNVVLRGEGAKKTVLRFNLGGTGDCISSSGSIGSSTSLTSNHSVGATELNIGSHSFAAGDWIRINQGDSNFITSSWSSGYVGQIVQVVSVQTNKIFIDEPLRIYLSLNQSPAIRKITPVENVGLEDFRLVRNDATSGQTSNVNFNYVVNSWVYGVESDSCNFGHVTLSKSSNVRIRGCYFHNAHAYGSGGQGYGVVVQYVSGNNLIDDNIFKRLRHAMLLQACPNGNVFAYNYSTDPYWTNSFVPSDYPGDVVLHGNYPYFNLFEGNIFNNLRIDASHGLNGTHNTFLRNRVENYGIIMSTGPASDSQTFVGNEITKTGSIYVFPLTYYYGQYTLEGSGHFEYNNNKNGTLNPSGSNGTFVNSLFLNSAPEYWVNSGTWPTIGGSNTLNTGTNPAAYRYANGSDMTTPLDKGTALPISLISFDAEVSGSSVELNWRTAQEINNDFFTLYKSFDDGELHFVAHVDGNGTSQRVTTYQHLDPVDRMSSSVYFLFQHDFDGRKTLVGTSLVDFKKSFDIQVKPNPFTDLLVIEDDDSHQIGVRKLVITNAVGAVVFAEDIILPYSYDATDLPVGIYQLEMISELGAKRVVRKVVKQP